MKKFNLLFHEVCNLEDCSNTGFSYSHNIPYSFDKDSFKIVLKEVKKLFSQNKNNFDYTFTFDDGGVSNIWSSQMLDEYGWKGLFFIPTQYIGKKGFMSETDITDLVSRGHSIASHSHSHPMPISVLTYDAQFEEWQLSKKILEEITGKPVCTAALPGGDYNSDTFPILSKTGYTVVYNSVPDPLYSAEKNNLHVMGRICFMRDFNETYINKLLLNDQKTYWKLKSIYRSKFFIKKNFPLIFKAMTSGRKHIN